MSGRLKIAIKGVPSGYLDALQRVSVQIEIANNPNKRRPAITLPARAKLQRRCSQAISERRSNLLRSNNEINWSRINFVLLFGIIAGK